ncbi:MAG: hypothetical protein KAJ31_07675 [Deltaproteobacteria bacterium]|nr:hypothetical protein [Deltaproteobacteria bacterium]
MRENKAGCQMIYNEVLNTILMEVVELNRAHDGDNSRVVPLVLSESAFNELFDDGALEVVDLRDFF